MQQQNISKVLFWAVHAGTDIEIDSMPSLGLKEYMALSIRHMYHAQRGEGAALASWQTLPKAIKHLLCTAMGSNALQPTLQPTLQQEESPLLTSSNCEAGQCQRRIASTSATSASSDLEEGGCRWQARAQSRAALGALKCCPCL